MSGDDWDSLTYEGATQTYGSGTTVGPLSFSARPGDVLGLIGANGSGKTTAMRMAAGLCRLTHGRILVDGLPVEFGTLPASCTALIEAPSFFLGLSGADNLQLAAAGRPERLSRIRPVLERVGLDPGDRRRVSAYSQGMRQRLGIARVLLAQSRLLLLDEPTNGLDPDGFLWLRSLIEELAADGITVVISSHLLTELESIATHAVVMRAGQVVATGNVGDLLSVYRTLEDLYFEVRAERS